ncbi:hypothetical protein [Gracilibacillus massiliensis]|uniref:hypothetical protein n=1 Tax=Gracilibacillus massiliensis TaxID=1564956 RepID=UPI000ACDB5AA|nr:hypothetical protein [Gracilibacillus massiliensis]
MQEEKRICKKSRGKCKKESEFVRRALRNARKRKNLQEEQVKLQDEFIKSLTK